jgi:hypothetical protein
MDRLNPLFLPQLQARIEDLKHTVEKFETRLSSAQLSDGNRELLGRLLVLTKEHLLEIKRNRVTLTESYALLNGYRRHQHPLFRPDIAPNSPTLSAPQIAPAAPGDCHAGRLHLVGGAGS